MISYGILCLRLTVQTMHYMPNCLEAYALSAESAELFLIYIEFLHANKKMQAW